MENLMNVLVGADPEVFMYKNNKVVSAFGMVKGDKKAPYPVKDGAVQVDGMALEFNIDPAKNEEEFVSRIGSVMATLMGMVPDFEVKAVPAQKFTKKLMSSQPKEAVELGCEPDYNAWTEAENPKPDEGIQYRTGSGHIHIGWTNGQDIHDPDHIEACRMLAKQMDCLVTIPYLYHYVLGDNKALAAEVKRRELYGMAGSFRPKPYGMEYRVLSNTWLDSEDRMKWVYRATINAVNKLFEGDAAYKRAGKRSVYAAINEGEEFSITELTINFAGRHELPKKVVTVDSRLPMVDVFNKIKATI